MMLRKELKNIERETQPLRWYRLCQMWNLSTNNLYETCCSREKCIEQHDREVLGYYMDEYRIIEGTKNFKKLIIGWFPKMKVKG